jgi:hypothetical protein
MYIIVWISYFYNIKYNYKDSVANGLTYILIEVCNIWLDK